MAMNKNEKWDIFHGIWGSLVLMLFSGMIIVGIIDTIKLNMPTKEVIMEITEDQAKVILGLCQYHDEGCGFLQDDQKQLEDEIKREFDLYYYKYYEED